LGFVCSVMDAKGTVGPGFIGSQMSEWRWEDARLGWRRFPSSVGRVGPTGFDVGKMPWACCRLVVAWERRERQASPCAFGSWLRWWAADGETTTRGCCAFRRPKPPGHGFYTRMGSALCRGTTTRGLGGDSCSLTEEWGAAGMSCWISTVFDSNPDYRSVDTSERLVPCLLPWILWAQREDSGVPPAERVNKKKRWRISYSLGYLDS
jgi:hypothetical protein